jgi:hypothetical protein
MNNKQAFFIGILLSAALGCVVPGLSAPAAAPPIATVTADSRLPTMVAETVAAAIVQTALALPSTPTLTATPEPPTPTAAPTATPPAGSALITQADSATLFTDEYGGYAIAIPGGWLAVRIGQQEFFDALSGAELSNPLLHESLIKIRDENPRFLRLFATNTQDAAAPGEPATTIKLILDETRGISFNSDQDLQALADELIRTTPGLEVTSLDILTTPAGVQFGALESEIQSGDGVMTYEKRVYFKAKTGMAYAWLTTGKNLKETVIPAFDAIMDTLKPIAQ